MSVYVDSGYPWATGGIVYLMVVIFAMYISYKRNGGVNLLSMAAAFFLTPLYLIYVLFNDYSGTNVRLY